MGVGGAFLSIVSVRFALRSVRGILRILGVLVLILIFVLVLVLILIFVLTLILVLILLVVVVVVVHDFLLLLKIFGGAKGVLVKSRQIIQSYSNQLIFIFDLLRKI